MQTFYKTSRQAIASTEEYCEPIRGVKLGKYLFVQGHPVEPGERKPGENFPEWIVDKETACLHNAFIKDKHQGWGDIDEGFHSFEEIMFAAILYKNAKDDEYLRAFVGAFMRACKADKAKLDRFDDPNTDLGEFQEEAEQYIRQLGQIQDFKVLGPYAFAQHMTGAQPHIHMWYHNGNEWVNSEYSFVSIEYAMIGAIVFKHMGEVHVDVLETLYRMLGIESDDYPYRRFM